MLISITLNYNHWQKLAKLLTMVKFVYLTPGWSSASSRSTALNIQDLELVFAGQWEKPEKVLLDPVAIAQCLHRFSQCAIWTEYCTVNCQQRLYWTPECDTIGKSSLVCITRCSALTVHFLWTVDNSQCSSEVSAKAASPFNPIKTHPGQRATLSRCNTVAAAVTLQL